MNKKIAGLLGLLLLAGIGWIVLGNGVTLLQRGSAPSTGQDLSAQMTASLGDVLTSLANVKDPATAEAVLPAVQHATNQFNAIAASAATLPADARKALATIGNTRAEKLQQEVMRLEAIPGVWELMKTKVERLLLLVNIINTEAYEVLSTLDNPT
ncbi:MAG: hypothetical protein ACT4N2_01600 [Hyphomicrobium sp.]